MRIKRAAASRDARPMPKRQWVTIVGDDMGAGTQPFGKFPENGQDCGPIGDAAVGDGDRDEVQTGLTGSLRLCAEAGLMEFGRGQRADQDVDALGSQRGHLIV